MRLRILLGFLLLFGFATTAQAQTDMEVRYHNYEGCQHTMSTNHFDLAPGEEVFISLDLTGCRDEDLGGLLFYGYHTTRTRSRQLTSRNRVFLSVIDDSAPEGELGSDDDGSVLVQLEHRTTLTLYAYNMNRNKTLKIRLVSVSGL